MKSISILFLILFTSAISVCQDINEGLLLDYSFNETTLDQSGNNYDGDPFGITYLLIDLEIQIQRHLLMA